MISKLKMDKTKKVLFLPSWYPTKLDPQLGVFLQKQAIAVSLYHKVAVLYIDQDPNLNQKSEVSIQHVSGITEIIIYYRKSMSSNSIIRKLTNLTRHWRALVIGKKTLRANFGTPDLTHVHILKRAALLAIWLKLTKGIPYFLSEQWSGYWSGEFLADNSKLVQKIKLWIGKNAESIIVVSESLKRDMKSHGFQNSYHKVYNIVEKVDVGPNNSQSGKIKIINISDFDDSKKNISGLIRAFIEAHKMKPELELHIIGSGQDASIIEQLVQDSELKNKAIFLYGRQPNTFVYELIPKMNFLIVNSRIETFSVVAAEGITNGKPVIVTRCGGPEGFVTQEVGISIDVDSDVQLTRAILSMAESFDTYNPEKLATYAGANFSYSAIGQQISTIYTTINNS